MQKTIIKNATLVNEGIIKQSDVLIAEGIIQEIGNLKIPAEAEVIDGSGKYLFPGVIDGQVHFRDPGLTHKADLHF
jgi:dihydroorotase